MANFKKHFKKHTEGSWEQFKLDALDTEGAVITGGMFIGMGIGMGAYGAAFFYAPLLTVAGGVVAGVVGATLGDESRSDKEGFFLGVLSPVMAGGLAGMLCVSIPLSAIKLASRTVAATIKASLASIRGEAPIAQNQVLSTHHMQAAMPAPVAVEFNLTQIPQVKTEPKEPLKKLPSIVFD